MSEPSALAGLRILLVEDEAMVAMIIEDTLMVAVGDALGVSEAGTVGEGVGDGVGLGDGVGGGGRVGVDIPKTNGKPVSRHGPGVKTLSGGPH